MTTDTPRTDAAEAEMLKWTEDKLVETDFARQLERELNEANRSNLELQRSAMDLCQERDRLKAAVDIYVKESAEWRNMADELEKALNGALHDGTQIMIEECADVYHWDYHEGVAAIAAYNKLKDTP